MLLVAFGSFQSFSQSTESRIKTFLSEHQVELGLSNSDINDWIISDQHMDKRTGITHAYIRQHIDKIEVYQAIAVFAITDEKVLMTSNQLIPNVKSKQTDSKPLISASQAISKASEALNIQDFSTPTEISRNGNSFLFDKGNGSLENIPVKLTWVPTDESLALAWDLSIYNLDAKHWWSIRIDAKTGTEIDRVDWVTHCSFEGDHKHSGICSKQAAENLQAPMPPPPPSTDQYNVFALPVESPNHGGRTLVVGPFDPVASPFGWHDTDGTPGAESTLTYGNNVRAYEDDANNNAPGYSPDGTAALDFDFPLNMSQPASGYQDPAITNLFYMNNMMHDIWYQYGFDEASGNFQENNYGNGGNASDRVNAEAQDGGGMNNANFATPPDGNNPRMQMYLWNNPGPPLLTINAPGSLAGAYFALPANFGPALTTTPITSDLVIYDDNTPDEYDACELPVNGAAMNGNIVVIRRGTCPFIDKVQRAQDAGAVAVIMVNNVSGSPINMGGTSGTINIPSVMVSDIDGEAIIAAIEGGATVNGTLVDSPVFDLDGDFDNGIIAHEYGHGISTRLTGGASNSNCLNNSEQMGEGWSDWFGIMITMKATDLATDNRGVGTFVTGESTSGVGIRPAPYNTDMNINGYTYAATNNTGAISQPHGIGFVWCTMLWDMSWALIDKYGFDPDMHNGTGGNNIAMNLVIEGLKLQPCGPGFVDGRDAIILADQLLYGGANECLLWNVFANRGLGYSANQGSASSRTDQTEAFDLPPYLLNVSGSESVTACGSYTWSANGVTYNSSGSYSEVLVASNGCDSTATLNLTIAPAPTSTQTASACNSYLWAEDGNTYTSSGSYTTTVTTGQGCDSIITLDLTILQTVAGTDIISACSQYTWIDGNTYTSSNNTATHTLTSSQGCDSVVTLDLTITPPVSETDIVTACSQYTWSDGNTYTANNNTATQTLVSSQGCDSIVTLDLTILSPTFATDFVTACEQYTWIDGSTYTSNNNTATYLLTNAQGCDSTVTLNLTITNPTTNTDVISSCGAYTWIDGNTYASNNNTATYTLTNSQGCDSIISLDLTVNQPTSATDVITACESYTWMNGNTYTSNNNSATYILTNAAGCDSVVTLNLTILNSTASTDVQTACDSYTWIDGNTYTSSNNSATHTLTNAQGCDSIVTLDLTIFNNSTSTDIQEACGSYTWIDGVTYTASTNNTTFVLTNAQGCDSIITLDLTINDVDASVTSNDPTLTANASGATYQWMDCNNGFTIIPGETAQEFTATQNGDYAVVVTENNCSDTSACQTISSIGLDEFKEGDIMQVFPNPTSDIFTVVFNESIKDATLEVYTMDGRLLYSSEVNSGETSISSADWARGSYLVTVRSSETNVTIHLLKE